MNYCLNCGKKISSKKKYCNNTCQHEFRHKERIAQWKRGEQSGLRGQYQISLHIRRYLEDKYGNKCARCGWHEVNPYTNKIPLEIDHIDGDYLNNKEENLILLCPNCHSLTSTYKGSNRGHSRQGRQKYYPHDNSKLEDSDINISSSVETLHGTSKSE